MKETFEHVAIAGAGLVGCGWAVQFALAGSKVALYDERAEVRQGLPSRLRGMLDDLETAGLAENTQEAFSRLRIAIGWKMHWRVLTMYRKACSSGWMSRQRLRAGSAR